MKPSEKISFQFSSSPSDSPIAREPTLNNNHDVPEQNACKQVLEGTTFSYVCTCIDISYLQTHTNNPATPPPSPLEVPLEPQQELPKDELDTKNLPQLIGENTIISSDKPNPAVVEIAIKTPDDVGASASVCSACSSLTEGIGYFSTRDNPDINAPSKTIRKRFGIF